jgi:hypothetical protein
MISPITVIPEEKQIEFTRVENVINVIDQHENTVEVIQPVTTVIRVLDGGLQGPPGTDGSFPTSGSYSFTGLLDVTGSLGVFGTLLVNGPIVATSFSGNGSNLFFTTLNTSESSNSTLLVGNIYGTPYENKQTTVFKNGDIVLSGSLYLEPQSVTPTAVVGGLFFSASNGLYVGVF